MSNISIFEAVPLHFPDNMVHTIYDNIDLSVSGRKRRRERGYTMVVD